jgi:hypothetical protein
VVKNRNNNVVIIKNAKALESISPFEKLSK